jgi:hypothetical protein
MKTLHLSATIYHNENQTAKDAEDAKGNAFFVLLGVLSVLGGSNC